METPCIIPYAPRPLQWRFHQQRTRFCVLLCHRRFGKTVAAVNDLLRAALRTSRTDWRAAYAAPYLGQAKAVAWDYLRHFAGVIPGTRFHEGELRCDLPNGARIRLYGTDNAQALRGLYLDDLVLDEPADIPREVWSQILRPALADRQGRALFCGTPKGCDNLLHDVWQLAGSLGASEGWSRFRFPASQTGYLPQTELDAARRRLGLDGPIWEQYQRWAGNVLDGDFGMSLKYKRPVVDVVLPLLGNTLLLGGLAYALVFVLAIALALLCARFEHSALDRLICRVGTTAYYVPAFWLGVLLVLVFSVNLEWLPSSGAYSYGKAGDIADRARHLVLPLAVMVASHLWYYAYMIRNKLLDEVRRDYVLLARSKGLGRTRVLWSHCLRNVMPTVVGIMAISIPHVLSGTYVAEAVFNYPGIGLLAISSAKYHDYNLLMLMVLFTGAMVISSSLLAQSINEAIDPRIKSGEVVC